MPPVVWWLILMSLFLAVAHSSPTFRHSHLPRCPRYGCRGLLLREWQPRDTANTLRPLACTRCRRRTHPSVCHDTENGSLSCCCGLDESVNNG